VSNANRHRPGWMRPQARLAPGFAPGAKGRGHSLFSSIDLRNRLREPKKEQYKEGMMDVVRCDEYFDIPLRGVVRTDSGELAFIACVLDDEPDELEHHRGIYSKISLFKCDDSLALMLAERDEIFGNWRAKFDERLVDQSSHPLLVDQRYQELSKRIDELFRSLRDPVSDAVGMMRVASGKWVFECL
jgi:hypothetical protein